MVSVLIAVPGPSVLFTISRALTVGRRAALLTVIGNELGPCVQVIAVAFGVGAVVERSAQVITVVKLVGAVYLAAASRRPVVRTEPPVLAICPPADVPSRKVI